MFCIRQSQGYKVMVEPLADSLKGPRKERDARLLAAMTEYSQRLEGVAKLVPLQWYNFFDFWRVDEKNQRHNPTSSQEI